MTEIAATGAVLSAIHARRSIPALDGEVEEGAIRQMLAAAVAAPNHKLTEPWRFIVLRGDARRRFGEAWAAVAVATTPLTDALRDEFVAREARKPLRAPVVIVVSVATAADPVRAAEDFAAAAAATQNLLLAAEALGYGAIWRTGAPAYASAVNAHLGLAASDRIVAFVYVGRAAGRVPPVLGRSLEGHVEWRS